MKLSSPKQMTFYVATALAVLGLLGFLTTIPFISAYAFWLVFIGFVVLFLGNVMTDF